MNGSTHGPLAGDADLERALAVLDWSFGGRLTWGAANWLGSMGHETARVLRDAGGVVQAVLCLLPMGQWFGGRRVATGGIAGVGTAPEARGQGASRALLLRVLRDLRADGVPLSTLYPASFELYRRNGFETAGSMFRYAVAARDIDVRDRELAVRELSESDSDAVVALHKEVAAEAPGNLDRGPQLWSRVRARRGVPATGFGVWAGGALEGYVFILQAAAREPGRHPYDLELTDVAARTGRAWRRILTLLRDHGSLGATVRWAGALVDPMAQLLAEEVYTVEVSTPWMLRLVDVDRALEARGWSVSSPHELHLDVADAALPENAGRRVLSVRHGEVTVRPGGDGALSLDVRALAKLYSGFSSATALTRVGQATGPPEAIATADAVFRGAHPWMPDMF
ncbi:MAG: GNAT family N-acetyltransferase [Deltaproteobacteria bacterium HGW-Deltaproteobacteria-14]|jgi:predicted acetyltransferase|nr:MAG: GNAT family N-acetyltransferase [Deltaproteobacteria bacterium HGW-Deltaproteobacteria-14]